MQKEDKRRIEAYQKVLAELGKIKFSGDIVETKEGFLRKRVVAKHVVFSSVEEAKDAKRQATELIREINAHTKRVKDDIKSLRQIYKERAGNVGSGAGFLGSVLGVKQKIIESKADTKRQYATERDARIREYEKVLNDFENIIYSCNAVKSDAEDWIAKNKK